MIYLKKTTGRSKMKSYFYIWISFPASQLQGELKVGRNRSGTERRSKSSIHVYLLYAILPWRGNSNNTTRLRVDKVKPKA